MANPFLRQAMPAHMTDAELDLMEKKLKNGAAVDEILKIMQRKRREEGLLGPSRATVYRFKKDIDATVQAKGKHIGVD